MTIDDAGTQSSFERILSAGLSALVDIEAIKSYRPNDPTPGSYGPAGYYPAGTPAGAAGLSSYLPMLLLGGAALVVVLLLVKR